MGGGGFARETVVERKLAGMRGLNVLVVGEHDGGAERCAFYIGQGCLVFFTEVVTGCAAVGFGYDCLVLGWVGRKMGVVVNSFV